MTSSTFATLTPIPSTGCSKPPSSTTHVSDPQTSKVGPIVIQIPDLPFKSGHTNTGSGLKVTDIGKLTGNGSDQLNPALDGLASPNGSANVTVIDASSRHRTIILQVGYQVQCDQIWRFIGLWATF